MSAITRKGDRVKTPVFPCDLCGLSEELVLRILKKADPQFTRIILERWFYDKSPGITTSTRSVSTKPMPNYDPCTQKTISIFQSISNANI